MRCAGSQMLRLGHRVPDESVEGYDSSELSATGTNHSVTAAEPALLRQFAECLTTVRSLIDARRSSAINGAVRLDCAASEASGIICLSERHRGVTAPIQSASARVSAAPAWLFRFWKWIADLTADGDIRSAN
jgi:hypothetical protein